MNSSHHQSVGKPGQGMRVSARTADGVIEALEWTAGPEWVVGVQWHPERMPDDPFASAIFRRLVSEASAGRKNPKPRLTRTKRPTRTRKPR